MSNFTNPTINYTSKLEQTLTYPYKSTSTPKEFPQKKTCPSLIVYIRTFKLNMHRLWISLEIWLRKTIRSIFKIVLEIRAARKVIRYNKKKVKVTIMKRKGMRMGKRLLRDGKEKIRRKSRQSRKDRLLSSIFLRNLRRLSRI
jgi:hypothetical protein